MPVDPMLRLELTFPHTLTDVPAEACTSATSLLFNEKPLLLKSIQLDVLVRHIHHRHSPRLACLLHLNSDAVYASL